ncbi:F-BAR domain only protein 2 isoform X1 [Octopus bimaculoides]|nr:F-BAR domain only protein 2 isoform X1 [Octopus bimaculoides]
MSYIFPEQDNVVTRVMDTLKSMSPYKEKVSVYLLQEPTQDVSLSPFKGEKNNGFFVLYHNMKHGQTASKEFIEFLRESCSVEENYSKLLTKLAKNVSNCIQEGTFSPFWNLLKSLVEKLATLHMQLVYTWSELIKDVARYNEEQHRRHKNMKETESATLEVVQSIQQTTTALHKAKEIYHTRVSELERLKKEGASQKDTEKAESKFRKANDEYQNLVDKYATVRDEFEKKMSQSCDQFQKLEEEHARQMKDFIDTYSKAWVNEHILLGQVHNEFRNNCDEMTVQKLIHTFVQAKASGKIRPGPKEFVEPDLSCLPVTRPMSPEIFDKKDGSLEKKKEDSSGSPSPVLAEAQPGPLSRSVKLRVSRTWFLKSKRDKKKDLKKKKKRDKEENQETASSNGVIPDVDEEGYSKQPDTLLDLNGDKTSWCSSESDSDSEGDSDLKKKIKVEIRPLSPNGSTPTGTVEDIRASIEGLRLSPTVPHKRRCQTPVDKKMKRSQSESDTLDPGKPSHDLLKLDLFNTSAASTPTGGNNYNMQSPFAPSSQTDVTLQTSDSGSTTTLSSSNASDAAITSQPNQDLCALPLPPNTKVVGTSSQTTSPVSLGTTAAPQTTFPHPPRPPSRTKTPLPQIPLRPGRTSPATLISPPDSTGSMFTTTASLGSSRGSSPLTLGMADTVPMAVAFTENINAFFKGTDATKCTVTLSGNLMMSFPAGIIKVLIENPSPSMLSFRLNGTTRLDSIRINSQLISQDTQQSTSNSSIYIFDMTALTEHLRAQGEINKSASYFNVDILKYQVKPMPGVDNTPLPLVVYWKCTSTVTNFRLDYKYNPCSMSKPVALKNIQVTVPVNGDVVNMQSIPNGNWNAEEKRATWKLDDISEMSENGTQGNIRAKFETSNGPSTPSPTALHFIAEGATLSGLEFELVGLGYRLSLVKKRFGAGKYSVEPDPDAKYT